LRKVGVGDWERPQIDAKVASLRNPIDEVEIQRPHAQHRFVQHGQQRDYILTA
jgi:hypothetical protein